jgi:C4-type Zn-finger protein
MVCPRCGKKTRVHRTERFDGTIHRVRICSCGYRRDSWETWDEIDDRPAVAGEGNHAETRT